MDFGKIQLDIQEHYILANLKNRIVQYALLWLLASAFAMLISQLPFQQPVSSYEDVQLAARAFLSIAVVTVTFAIPTCMRTIFSAYEQYYSTKIKEVLLERFPVTLLALSAFTALLVSLFAITGIWEALPLPPAFSFYVCLFWTLVCIAYLFVAIEKLIYFVVRAPFAVLDKLGYNIDATLASAGPEEYAEFRRELASMNDIAATILAKSTGRDEAVLHTLDFFRATHARYAPGTAGEDGQSRKRRLNACRAVNHEIVRVFREACSNRNEQAARRVMKTYCGMLADAAAANVPEGYFDDMLIQLERMLSYAIYSKVEEVEYLAAVGWFFMLGQLTSGKALSGDKRASVARRLSASLRSETVAGSSNVITKFLRTAANSDLEYNIDAFDLTWQLLLDRGVFVYLVWLLDTAPSGASRQLGDIHRYSSVKTDAYRNVLPDSSGRLKGLFLSETMDSSASGTAGSGETVMMMGMDWGDNLAHTLGMMCVLRCSGVKVSALSQMGTAGMRLCSEIAELPGRVEGDDDASERIDLARIVDDAIDEQIAAAHALSEGTPQSGNEEHQETR